MLTYLKTRFPNVYILIVSISIALFFEGISRIVNELLPSSLLSGICLSTFSLAILYFDDFQLSELYSLDSQNDESSTTTTRTASAMEMKTTKTKHE
mmetsp:Transcript_244/g.436  ORF Transcript_244/g.436 Transcript_244/m.436 type:complete len:96 (-) Transcript_244:131-418(-)